MLSAVIFLSAPVLMVLTSLAEKQRATLPVQSQRENHAIRACHAGQELKSQADSDIRIGHLEGWCFRGRVRSRTVASEAAFRLLRPMPGARRSCVAEQ